MENQGGLLRGTIIAGAITATIVYLLNNQGERTAAGSRAAANVGDAVGGFGSSEIGQRVGRIVQLLLSNVTDSALQQVKDMLKGYLHEAEDAVDQM